MWFLGLFALLDSAKGDRYERFIGDRFFDLVDKHPNQFQNDAVRSCSAARLVEWPPPIVRRFHPGSLLA